MAQQGGGGSAAEVVPVIPSLASAHTLTSSDHAHPVAVAEPFEASTAGMTIVSVGGRAVHKLSRMKIRSWFMLSCSRNRSASAQTKESHKSWAVPPGIQVPMRDHDPYSFSLLESVSLVVVVGHALRLQEDAHKCNSPRSLDVSDRKHWSSCSRHFLGTHLPLGGVGAGKESLVHRRTPPCAIRNR